jgi:putative transposase
MPTPRRVPDDLWSEIEKRLPPLPPPEHGGHPRTADRLLLDGMLHLLWTGSPWRSMPKEFGPWQTVYDRFAEWKRAGIFEQIWALCLHLYDDKHSIQWEWQAADGTYVRSPEGGKRNRPQSHGSG